MIKAYANDLERSANQALDVNRVELFKEKLGQIDIQKKECEEKRNQAKEEQNHAVVAVLGKKIHNLYKLEQELITTAYRKQ